ncbi:hypothetical protein H4Q26_017865 [Puccinia striiformis f. sp. tritici PST-130]|nr:hypothetical protein H4Q26_017865 [Puccinia striiformis f. sp. tritici PST-130]
MKWHVYAGLAILNPIARVQIDQFARSVTELSVLMVSNDEEGLRKRVHAGRDHVFGPPGSPRSTTPPMFLSEEIFTSFAIGEPAAGPSPPNSHLTILAIVDCWHQLCLNPFIHLERLLLLDKAIHAAVHNLDYRADDCEFVLAARGWSQCISCGDFELYQDRFQHTAEFFKPRIEEGKGKGNAMMKYILKVCGSA